MDLLRGKVSTPRVGPGLVSRPRLTELLSATPARLVVVSAPPGFGKTSAVVDWVTTAGRRAAWVSLDESDNDPGRLVPSLVAVLSGGQPGALVHLGEVGEPVDVAAGLARLLEEPDAPEVLVLDDYQVISDRTVHAVVEALLAALPHDRRLVISTREDPPLRLARLRAAGELVEVRAEQLRFTQAEADQFLRRRMGLTLPLESVAVLTETTEGWPAVLQLVALTLSGRPDAAARAAALAAEHRFVLDYVTEEVLARLDGPTIDFLLRTAHLDRLTGELCDAVTGRTDGAETLRELERANLLLLPLDDQRRWYRFHRLFAELLRTRAGTVAGDVHLRAARWLIDHDLPLEAIGQAVRAGYPANYEVIWRAGALLIHSGELRALQAALDLLPDDVAHHSVLVCLLQGWASALRGEGAAARGWLDHGARAARDAAPGTDPLAVVQPGLSAQIRSTAARAEGRHAEAVAQAEAALGLLPPGLPPEREVLYRGDALTVLGHALLAAGEVDRAVAAYEEALPLLASVGNRLAVAEMVRNLARIELGRGRPEAALAACDRFPVSAGDEPSAALVRLAHAEALLALDDPDAAAVARSAMELARSGGDLTTLTEARSLATTRRAGTLPLPDGQTLSAREQEVLALMATGRSNARIAAELYVTVGTVKTHVHAIATKLGTANRVEAVARARELHLLG